MGRLAQSCFRMGTADVLIDHTNKKRSCIVVDQHISHTHIGVLSDFFFCITVLPAPDENRPLPGNNEGMRGRKGATLC